MPPMLFLRRVWRHPFVITAMACGIVLGTIPRAATAAGPYEDLPVHRWSWEDVLRQEGGQQVLDRELVRQGESVRRWHAVHELLGDRLVSRKSQRLLAERGLGPARLDAPGAAKAYDGVDTLNVLLVRISFEENRDPHLTTIAPDGDFVLEPLADPKPLEIDPPPRNKAFFESHLTGLSEYYQYASGGRLHISGRVLPEGAEDSYKIRDVAEYGPGADGFWSLEGLEAVVHDMIESADVGTQADGAANLADFDDDNDFAYVIFVHAGSDWQSDIAQDSPNDIPTFFVTLGEPVPLMGTDSGTGAAGRLSECSVIPETTNQDDYPGSIAAAFYHEFGHALGLPDVYDTERGLPSAGIWDLMDSGTNVTATVGTVTAEDELVIVVAAGVLPPSISAWNKWYLGWLELDEIDGRGTKYQLPAVSVPREDYWFWRNAGSGAFVDAYPQAWRAGVSPREWFLVENRFVPKDAGETPYSSLAFERDEETGVIQYLAGLRKDVWGNSGLYDFFMPAGGVLVWHVNEDRIENELPTNTINVYGDGLKLIEADGIQDIGVLDAYVLGWTGSGFDPFAGYEFDEDGNRIENEFRELYAEGFPSSRHHDRSWSGFSLSDIMPRTGVSPSVMEFRASISPLAPIYPWEVDPVSGLEAAPPFGNAGPRAIDPATLTPIVLGDQQVLVFADAPGETYGDGIFVASLYGLRSSGGPLWAQATDRPEGAFAAIGSPVVGSPAVVDNPAGGVVFVFGNRTGDLRAFDMTEFAPPTLRWQVVLPDTAVTGPLPLVAPDGEMNLLVATGDSRLLLYDLAGQPVGDPLTMAEDGPGAPQLSRACLLPGLGVMEEKVGVLSRRGVHVVSQKAGGLDGTPVFLPYEREAEGDGPWLSVLRRSDHLLLHACDGSGELGTWRITADGAVEPLGLVLELGDNLVAAPAVADVDGDGRDDLVALTPTRILGLRDVDVPLRGYPRHLSELFPLADSVRVAGPLIVADATGDGANDIFFNTDGGHLLGLGDDGQLLDKTPFLWGDHRTAGMAVGGDDADRTLWLVSQGGYTGPPFGRQYIGGRVSAYQLAGASAVRTSEWLGTAGGAYRRGPEGDGHDLGLAGTAVEDRSGVVVFPNPVTKDFVGIRFYAGTAGLARFAVFNLEGELVREIRFPVEAGEMVQQRFDLPDLAGGLYVGRLMYPGPGGEEIRTMTLAVAR